MKQVVGYPIISGCLFLQNIIRVSLPQARQLWIFCIQDYNFSILHGTVSVSSWRQLLFWLGPPGLAIAALALLTLDEPRKPVGNILGDVFTSSKFTSPATRDLSRSQKDSFEATKISKKKKADESGKSKEGPSIWSSVKELVGSPVFQVGTSTWQSEQDLSYSLDQLPRQDQSQRHNAQDTSVRRLDLLSCFRISICV